LAATAPPLHARPPIAGQAQKLALSSLTVATAKRTHRFKVQVARAPREQEIGLMFRTSLPANEGMLFVFAQPKLATFWMQNVPIPLDLLFIRVDGTIANIAAKAPPMSTDIIPSQGRVIGVLELAGGRAAELGIAPGDRISHPALLP
jgi:uncharacterized protein